MVSIKAVASFHCVFFFGFKKKLLTVAAFCFTFFFKKISFFKKNLLWIFLGQLIKVGIETAEGEGEEEGYGDEF